METGSGVNYATEDIFRNRCRIFPVQRWHCWQQFPVLREDSTFLQRGDLTKQKQGRINSDRTIEYKWIDSVTYENARHELSHMPVPKKEYRSNSSLHAILAIQKYLNDNPVSSINPYNPTIRLSLDLQLQDIIQQIVFSQMENLRAFDCENCAVLVLDKSSGKVLSYIGNEYYFDSTTAGNIDFVQVPRSTGSILKPFIYACGMEFNGYNESTLLTDVGLHFGDGKNPYITRNYDNEFIGPVLYKTALANSRNIPTVQVLRCRS